MEKAELIKALRSEMEDFFGSHTFRGDYDGRIATKMQCEFNLPEGYTATVQTAINGYEHTDRGDHDIPPTSSGVYWVDAQLATFYNADGEQAFEERYNKNLIIQIKF